MAASFSDENESTLTNQFEQLVERSCSLLHHFDGLKWTVIDEPSSESANKVDDDVVFSMAVDDSDDDDQSDSSSDDGMMMFGGGLLDSDSDNDDDNNNNNNATIMDDSDETNQDDYYEEENMEEEEEEDAALLKRASSVHVALLTTFSSSSSTAAAPFMKNGRELVEILIASILFNSSSSSPPSTTTINNSNHDDEDVKKLIHTLSNILLKSSPELLPKQMSDERKRKIGLTNSLLAVQYLLHLLGSSSSSSSLLGWQVVILPLVFSHQFKFEPVVQTALLDLLSPSTTTTTVIKELTNDQLEYCHGICQLCVSAVDQLSTSSSTISNNSQREAQLVLVCDVLIRLYDGMNKLLEKLKQRRGGGGKGEEEKLELLNQCVNSVADAMHLVVMKVIRGICYAPRLNIEEDDNENVGKRSSEESMLSLEAIRPITGMLLPKLYSSNVVGSDGLGKEQQSRVVELWNELLLLLSSSLDEVVFSSGRKCCKNW